MDPLLKAQLNQVISIRQPTGVDVYGEPGVGTATICRVRIEAKTKEVATANGEFARSSTMIILDERAPTLSLSSLIFLPGVSAVTLSSGRRPLQVKVCVDENGLVDHQEVLL